MPFQLPPLPYAMNALEPYISRETLEYHYGKHHKAYVDKLNTLVQGTEFEKAPLEEIVRRAQGGIFNNAAQVWNHTFYWHCLSPQGGGEPAGAIRDAIQKNFQSFEEFKKKFSEEAAGFFGSGWTWLVKKKDGTLSIESLANAGNPLTQGETPLLTLDIWEHAYYIDYRNARPKYIENFWNLVNWAFVESQLEGAGVSIGS